MPNPTAGIKTDPWLMRIRVSRSVSGVVMGILLHVMLTGRLRLTEKKHERARDEHGGHQDFELIDDRDNGRLLGDHAVERGKTWHADCPRDMRGGAVRREVLGERDVHGLGVVVEEDLDHCDADRAAIEARQVEEA